MNYHILREIADSWVLLALFIFFVATFAWAWRPGSRRVHDDAANVPFRHEDSPHETRETDAADRSPSEKQEARP
jgi:cytochrome c oxidase cbb3-type subunit 4